MITNDRQYQSVKKKYDVFQEAFQKVKDDRTLNPIQQEIRLDALRAQMEIFEEELRSYEQLKERQITDVRVDSFRHLHEPLIKGRIARGWTQAQLAKKLELKEQQIQRYEQTNYTTASMARIQEVAEALDIEIKKFTVQIMAPSMDFKQSPEVTNRQIEIRSRKMLLPI